MFDYNNVPVRMVAPDWAKKKLSNGLPNPKFEKYIGPNTVEGYFSPQKVKELNEKGYSAFWFRNHPKEPAYNNETKFLCGKHIDQFDYIFADYDSKDNTHDSIEAFLEHVNRYPLPPTAIVKSGNGVHLYWKINDLDRDSYIKAQFGLINHFKTDRSVSSVLQLMRIPETLNTKELGNFKRTTLDYHPDNVYDIGQFDFTITEAQELKFQRQCDRLDGVIRITEQDVDLSQIPPEVQKFIMENDYVRMLFEQPLSVLGKDRSTGADRPDRSMADYLLAGELRKAGFSQEQALATVANTQKSLEKSSSSYAELTVDKAYTGGDPTFAANENLPKVIKNLYGILL